MKKSRDLYFLDSFSTFKRPETFETEADRLVAQNELNSRNAARQSGKNDYLRKLWRQYYEAHPQEILLKGTEDDLIQYLEERNTNGMWSHITINIDPYKWNANVLVSLLHKPRIYVRRWIAVFEYYTTKPGEEFSAHPHIHLLIEKKKEYYAPCSQKRIIDDYYTRFKEFVQDPSKIDVKMKKQPRSTFQYIIGNKSERYKKENTALDYSWREKMGLKHVYGTWFEFDDDEKVSTGLVDTSVPQLIPLAGPPNLYELQMRTTAPILVCELCDQALPCACKDQQD